MYALDVVKLEKMEQHLKRKHNVEKTMWHENSKQKETIKE